MKIHEFLEKWQRPQTSIESIVKDLDVRAEPKNVEPRRFLQRLGHLP